MKHYPIISSFRARQRDMFHYYSFNQFLKDRFGERVQKITLDAGLTCPNRDGTKGFGGCIYCDRYGSGTGNSLIVPDLRSQARSGIDHAARRYHARKFIAYFQSFSNTYAPVHALMRIYDQVVNLPNVVGLSVATRPDCITNETLDLLASYTPRLMVWLELGLQSAHDDTLRLINRGHTYQEFLDAYELARQYPLLICTHVIIGLPGEERHHILYTARELARLKPDSVKIHSLYISQGTPLEKLYHAGHYMPLDQHEFVSMACDLLELLPSNTIIQRLTGDPRPEDLIAPDWTLRKHETIRLIYQEMERRGRRR